MKTNKLKITLLVLAGISLPSAIAEPATVVNKASLKDAPQFQSGVIKELSKGDKVDIIRRQRAWYLVNTMPDEGWVNMLKLRYDIEQINQRSTSLLSSLGLKKGHDNVTATTGVRGLDVAELKSSKPNFEGLMFAQKYLENRDSAKQFASQIPLLSQKIKYQEVSDD